MNREQKNAIISKYGSHPKDTGSAQVQVAILTHKIVGLQKHLSTHSKDNHSRRGLIKMVGDRRRHLRYLQLNDKEAYTKIIKELELK